MPPAHPTSNTPTPTRKDLPRILCLHGGGVTPSIFSFQLSRLTHLLSPHFRLVHAEGPFISNAGPGIAALAASSPQEWAGSTYKRWLRWLPDEHAEVDDETAMGEIEYALASAMEGDDNACEGGAGEWVGLLGFSQGAKVVASILFDYEMRVRRWEEGRRKAEPGEERESEEMPRGIGGGRWKFGVCISGRAPLVRLSEASEGVTAMINAGGISEGGQEFDHIQEIRALLTLPTLHVHGLQDPGLHLHRRLVDLYCKKGSAEVVEWDGGHRVPLKMADLQRVADGVVALAEVGALRVSLSSLQSAELCDRERLGKQLRKDSSVEQVDGGRTVRHGLLHS